LKLFPEALVKHCDLVMKLASESIIQLHGTLAANLLRGPRGNGGPQ
jgi:dihydroxyacetone kinase-like predicted kinase